MELLPSFELNIHFITFCFLAGMLFFQLLYVFVIYVRFAFYKEKKQAQNMEFPPVSVVIAARNESDNLHHFLPLILNQNYPDFEVVVVNHQSIDESYNVLNALKMLYPDKLKVVEVERSRHLGTGKKFPLSLGIKAAKHEYFVMTDADCAPTSDNWLRLMVSKFSDKKELVLGYAPYKVSKGFLNKIIRLDTAMIAMNYFSFALARLPYMGVGRNIAYTKKLFNSVNGFKSHYAIISGDDDLFVQDTARNKNYCIQIDDQAHCVSKAKESWASWATQKSRHYSTSPKYQVIKKLLLGIYPLTLLLAWISFVILLFNSEYRILSSAIFGFVVIIKWWIQGLCLAKLKAKSFIALFPFLDLFYAILIPWMYYTSEKSTQTKWK
ncbi:MAG: glycosyltransferase [Flavobacteriia bacterium]|jgi:glycosyltransferase involved in cell wall biosynthesis